MSSGGRSDGISDNRKPVVVERRRTVLSPYVTLCERVVEVPGSGEPQVFHSLDQADYVSVLAETKDGQIVLVRQFRPAIEAVTLELPSGLLETGEDPGACAVRELQEEAGFRPTAEPVFLGKVMPDVGRLENALWAYLAQGVEAIEGWSAEPGVERVLMSKSEFRDAVARGELTDAPHLGVLALAQAQGRF